MPDRIERIVVFLPNWVGDAVMFTPTLRAVRALAKDARLALVGRPAAIAVLTPNPWTDDFITDDGKSLRLIRALRRGRFDLAVLGPNSFRSALVARLSGAPRRLGYDRDGRGWLLTDKLIPPLGPKGFEVVPALDYYLELANYLGCTPLAKRMELGVSAADEAAAERLLGSTGVSPVSGGAKTTGQTPVLPLVVINPGASFGSAKVYPPARFARVADELVLRRGARIVINAAPAERALALAVERAMKHPPAVNLANQVNSIGLVKALVKRADLLLTNDTGPRHFAAAFGVPVVTIFGATDPDWTIIYYDRERIVRVRVPCGPCQRPTCPKRGREHHQCMLAIPPEMVLAAAEELLASRGRP